MNVISTLKVLRICWIGISNTTKCPTTTIHTRPLRVQRYTEQKCICIRSQYLWWLEQRPNTTKSNGTKCLGRTVSIVSNSRFDRIFHFDLVIIIIINNQMFWMISRFQWAYSESYARLLVKNITRAQGWRHFAKSYTNLGRTSWYYWQ